jgi:hypothetical protein
MIRSTALYAFALVLLGVSAAAASGPLGIGIILGEPTGLSGELWLGNDRVIDGAAAWSFRDDPALHLHADYLFYHFDLFDVTTGRLPLYYGVGGRIRFEDDTNVGIRFPVGLEYIFAEAPLDVFVEIAPLLELAPSTDFSLNGAVGIRYFLR